MQGSPGVVCMKPRAVGEVQLEELMLGRLRDPVLIAPSGLVIGAVFGMAGTFVPSASLRGLLWGLDGIALIVATALLTIHHFRRGNDVVAAGFLVFVVGETLILSGAAMDLAASGPMFAAGSSL
jgi:hypothetical protein